MAVGVESKTRNCRAELLRKKFPTETKTSTAIITHEENFEATKSEDNSRTPRHEIHGRGERGYVATLSARTAQGNTIALLSEDFDPPRIERLFGYGRLFDKVASSCFPKVNKLLTEVRHISFVTHRAKMRALKQNHFRARKWNLVFSTQDAGYIPGLGLPVLQWGYFPKHIPSFFEIGLLKAIRSFPISRYYRNKMAIIPSYLGAKPFRGFADRELLA